jgi:hypothetical protein
MDQHYLGQVSFSLILALQWLILLTHERFSGLLEEQYLCFPWLPF